MCAVLIFDSLGVGNVTMEMQFNFNNQLEIKQMYDPEYDPIIHMVDVNSRESIKIYKNSLLDFYIIAYRVGAIGEPGPQFL